MKWAGIHGWKASVNVTAPGAAQAVGLGVRILMILGENSP